jgi:hypothetical protein
MIVGPFLVLNDSADPICKPLVTIKSLLRAACCHAFNSRWGQAPGGDWHAVAAALMKDLAGAGQSGWIWCRASCSKLGDHSWLECGGWAFDASNGCRRGVIVAVNDIMWRIHERETFDRRFRGDRRQRWLRQSENRRDLRRGRYASPVLWG